MIAEQTPEEVIERQKAAVYRLAYSRLQNREDAEDVLQEVFLRYIRNAPEFESPEHEHAWFIRVTVNCAKDQFKTYVRKNTASDDNGETLERFAERRDDGAPEFGALERALAELKPEAREIVHLYYYEGYRTAEIASVVGIGEGSVRSSLARSRRRIKKILEKNCIAQERTRSTFRKSMRMS